MRVTSLSTVIILLVVVVSTSFAGPSGRLLITQRTDLGTEDTDIALLQPDGSDRIVIYDDAEWCTNASFSPDASMITMGHTSDPSGGARYVFVVDTDGSNLTQLTSIDPTYMSHFMDMFRVWFLRSEGAIEDRYIMEVNIQTLDTSRVQARGGMTSNFDMNDSIVVFDWSTPTSNSGAFDIYSAPMTSLADAETWVRLTSDNLADFNASISPDGSRIAWQHSHDNTNGLHYPYNIWVMDIDGSNKTQLTFAASSSEFYSHPVWSLDGGYIACIYYDGIQHDIYLMTASGDSLTNITNTPTISEHSWDWTPYIPGDVNCDFSVNVADVTSLVCYLFQGCTPLCNMHCADPNGDSDVNISDLTYLVDYLFRGGPAPVFSGSAA